MWLPSLAILVLCHITAQESPPVRNTKGIQFATMIKINQAVDILLKKTIDDNLDTYEPFLLPNKSLGFRKEILFVPVRGEAKLHNGVMYGLSSLHRNGDCMMEPKDDMLILHVNVGAGTLDIRYDGTVSFMLLGVTIGVKATVRYIAMNLILHVNSTDTKDVKMKKFTVKDIEGLKVEVRKLGPLNWVLQTVVNFVTNFLDEFFKVVLEKTLSKHIAKVVADFPIPF